MKILLTGFGSIARRHLRLLRELEPDLEVGLVSRSAAASGRRPEGVSLCVSSIEEVDPSGWDGAVIASVAPRHAPEAIRMLEAGTPTMIEKPLADSPKEAAAILRAAQATGAPAFVGYNFRFYEPLLKARELVQSGQLGRVICLRAHIGSYLPSWRPGRDYRETASATPGGGALMELSHELDYVTWLLGAPERVTAVAGTLSDLELEVEDLAEILLMFEGGAIASVHVDMVDRSPTRTCRIIGTQGSLELDFLKHELALCAEEGEERWSFEGSRDRDVTYRAQLERLLALVDGQRPRDASVATLESGQRVLELIDAIKASSRQLTWVQP